MVLRDLKLKSEALNALKLPVTVKAGFLGTITLKVNFCFLVTWLKVSVRCVVFGGTVEGGFIIC